ncbi:hypothetical protein AAZV13_01G057100 [Glycine max]
MKSSLCFAAIVKHYRFCSRVDEVLLVVNNIQLEMNNNFLDDLMEKGNEAQDVLEHALTDQEAFWREKASVAWHLQGDCHTKFFHLATKIKRAKNTISLFCIMQLH